MTKKSPIPFKYKDLGVKVFKSFSEAHKNVIAEMNKQHIDVHNKLLRKK